MNLGQYGKFWLAIIAAVVSWVTLIAKSPADAVTASEWIILATGGASAITVWLIPNWTWKYAKFVGAGVTGVLGWGVLVVNSVPAAVTSVEWSELLVVVVTAAGVYVVSNAPESTPDLTS